MSFSSEDSFKHSVLDVAQRINGSYTGSSDSIPEQELEALSSWLHWRITENWAPTLSTRPEVAAFDRAVQEMAMAAVSMAHHELKRLKEEEAHIGM